MGRRLVTRTARGRRGGLLLGRVPEPPFSSGTAGLGRRKATGSLALPLARVRPLWREKDPCVKGWRHVTPGKSRKLHALLTWQGMVADLGVQGFPHMATLMIGVSGYLRTHHAYQSVAARCGRQRSLEPPGAHDDSIMLDSPYLVSWIGPVLKVLTEGHPDEPFFEFNCPDFLEQFRIGRKRLGLDDLVPCQMRSLGVSIDVTATTVHVTLRKTRVTASH